MRILHSSCVGSCAQPPLCSMFRLIWHRQRKNLFLNIRSTSIVVAPPAKYIRPSGSCPTSRQGIVSGTRYHLNRDWCECKAMWLFHDLSSRRAAVCTGCNLAPRWWCHSEGNPAQDCSNASPHMHTSDAEFCSPSSTVNSIQFHFPGSGSANTYVKCSWVCMQHSTMSHYRVNPPFAINK